MQRIAAEWEAYRVMVVPSDAEEIQLRETRKAFYAGATSLFMLLAGNHEVESLLSGVEKELIEFKQKLDLGVV